MQIENNNYKKGKRGNDAHGYALLYSCKRVLNIGMQLLCSWPLVRSRVLPLRKSGMDLTIGWRLVVRRWNDLAGGCSKDDGWLLEQVESNGVISKEAWAWERYRRERGAQIYCTHTKKKSRENEDEQRRKERIWEKEKIPNADQSNCTPPPPVQPINSNNKSKEKQQIHSQSHNKKMILFHSPTKFSVLPPTGLFFLSIF